MKVVTYDPLVVEESVREILAGLGVDCLDPNFKDTPARVARAYREMCGGLWADDEIATLFTKIFPST